MSVEIPRRGARRVCSGRARGPTLARGSTGTPNLLKRDRQPLVATVLLAEAYFSYTPELGYIAAAIGLGATLYCLVASSVGAARGVPELVVSGRRALLTTSVLTTIAVASLALSLLARDFSVEYVWQTSNLTTPLGYRLAAVWGGQSGSLLFWAWLLSLFATAAVVRRWQADDALLPWFTAITAGVAAFFLFLVVFVSNPFERLPVLPADGSGLNPLLLHWGMAFHPPALYLGFTGMTVPFAFAMAALITRRTDPGWILASRRWLLVAWLFLSIGLFLGARWAYDVLGWGGYWGWDPVENAALMPWLAATAFLHSVMVQERRGAFKAWNVALIILVFSLTIIGTFLTRAGLVSSVHSFAQSAIGPYFLVFTAVVILGSLALMWYRLPDLRPDARIESAVSREGAFLANNVLFMGALFAVFWGTMFPLLSEIATEQRVTVGPPYFNRMVLPIMWVIIVAMAIAPLVGWRRADGRRIAASLFRPLAASLIVSGALWLAGIRQWVALVGWGTCVFALLLTLAEYGRGIRARVTRGDGALDAAGTLLRRNRRRYGGYIVHIGVIAIAVGVIGSGLYGLDEERVLEVGETTQVGGYAVTYHGLGYRETEARASVLAELQATD